MKIIRCDDCGNSPKNTFVQNFVISLIKQDTKALSQWISDEIEWLGSKGKIINGKSEFLKEFTPKGTPKPSSLRIINVMSHGKVGAAHGLTRLAGGKEAHFCHVLEFTSASGKGVSKIYTYQM